MVQEIKRYALIINGDTEERHLQNVEKSLAVLNKEGYETYVASSSPPVVHSSHYQSATIEQIRALVEQLNAKISDNDELVIYTTGHGNKTGEMGTLCLENGCDYDAVAQLLGQIRYGKRTVIMDQCYSGNWAKLFREKPKTLFISAGDPDEKVCCSEFSPRFWAEHIPDLNGDGVISWQERYANVLTGGIAASLPQFVITPGFVEPGDAPFKAKVTEVREGDVLKALLKKLTPGQYAIINFSATWCEPCQVYKPVFEKMARGSEGTHLFLRTENEEVAKAYGITSFPTILVIDHQGIKQIVNDREKIVDELARFHLSLEDRRILLHEQLQDVDPQVRGNAARAYGYFLKRMSPGEAGKEAEILIPLFEDPDAGVRSNAVHAYFKWASEQKLNLEDADKLAGKLRNLFKDSDPAVRSESLRDYGDLSQNWSLEEAGKGAEKVRLFFSDSDRNVRINAAYVCYCLIAKNKLKHEEMNKMSIDLRNLFGHSNPLFRNTAVGTYSFLFLSDLLTTEERKNGIEGVRMLFEDSDAKVRRTAIQAYEQLALTTYMNREEANVGAEALYKRFDDPDLNVRRAALNAFFYLNSQLNSEEISEEVMRKVSKFFADSKVSEQAHHIYEILKDKQKIREENK